MSRNGSKAPLTIGRRNSLNALRLGLALAVIFGHGISMGGYHFSLTAHLRYKTTLQTVAVYGFFGISGYLIAASASHNTVGRYLWHRFLRIFPAFWVCLIVTAFGVGWFGFIHSPHWGGLARYVQLQNGPFQYIWHNWFLRITQGRIAHRPFGVPDPGWNGSLWTLFYEVLCYLLIAALALAGLLRRRRWVLMLAGAIFALEAGLTAVPSWNVHFTQLVNADAMNILGFFPLFLTGSLLYLYRERIPDSGWIALVSLGVFGSSIWLPIGAVPEPWRMGSTSLLAPALVYPVLWLGAHLPLERVGARNDYSYGTYIYAYPVQQTLAILGVQRWGYLAFTFLGVAATAPLAVASWWLVERPALSLKGFVVRRARAELRPPAVAASDDELDRQPEPVEV